MTVIPFGRPAAAALTLVAGIGVIAFVWPFFASPEFVRSHGNDTPWLFAGILALLTLVALAEVTAGRLDAKTIAVLGVTAAAGARCGSSAPARRASSRCSSSSSSRVGSSARESASCPAPSPC